MDACAIKPCYVDATAFIAHHNYVVVILVIHKLEEDYDPRNAPQAIIDIEAHKKKGKILTRLLYFKPTASHFHEINNTCDTPLNPLSQEVLCPDSRILTGINDSFR